MLQALSNLTAVFQTLRAGNLENIKVSVGLVKKTRIDFVTLQVCVSITFGGSNSVGFPIGIYENLSGARASGMPQSRFKIGKFVSRGDHSFRRHPITF